MLGIERKALLLGQILGEDGDDELDQSIAGHGASSVRDVVRELAESTPTFSFEDVMHALRIAGNDAQPTSVQSILSRLKREGLIRAGHRRGEYAGASSLQSVAQRYLETAQSPRQGGSAHLFSTDEEGGDGDGHNPCDD